MSRWRVVRSGLQFRRYMNRALSTTEPGQVVDLRVERDLVCGSCGVLRSRTNKCSGCGGYASPAPNLQLLAKVKPRS